MEYHRKTPAATVQAETFPISVETRKRPHIRCGAVSQAGKAAPVRTRRRRRVCPPGGRERCCPCPCSPAVHVDPRAGQHGNEEPHHRNVVEPHSRAGCTPGGDPWRWQGGDGSLFEAHAGVGALRHRRGSLGEGRFGCRVIRARLPRHVRVFARTPRRPTGGGEQVEERVTGVAGSMACFHCCARTYRPGRTGGDREFGRVSSTW
mmetsp:Transcript_54560/g.145682  ORF Transcript_54560/g.145682 Transcript_54560/m.145682 type:complete len:205 (+) Transcript_54560:151-765(+)